MNLKIQHLKKGSKKRTGKVMFPTKITIHGTGNPRSTAQNERDYLENPINTNSTGYHYVVGDSIIIECIPPNEVAYHAGHSVGNSKSIGIEMVETGDRQKVIANTIKLVKSFQKRFNISNDNIVRHFDWTKKNCPRILNYNNWQGWIEFKTLLRSGNNMTEAQIRSIVKDELNKSSQEPSSWAKDSWEKATRIGITDGGNPKRKASREEVVEMIFRASK